MMREKEREGEGGGCLSESRSIAHGDTQAFSLPECREERRKSSFYQL
jgi:hypothetical protein